jgi:hypothetical protein
VALLVKHSLLILFPFYALAWFFWEPCSLKAYLRDALVTSSLALAVIGIGYGLAPVPADYQKMYNSNVLPDQGFYEVKLLRGTEDSPWLRPWSWYASGLYGQGRHIQRGHDTPSYFQGAQYQGGRWEYFPLLFVFKEPFGFLLLIGLAVLVAPQIRPWPPALRAYLTFIALFVLVSCKVNLNLGIRHLLPILPLVYASTAWVLARTPSKSQRLVGRVTALAGLWAVLSVSLAWPGYLSYFNELAGGKRGGPAIALDSNYDWGQDLLRLRRWMDAHPELKIYTLYYGRNYPGVFLDASPLGYNPLPANPQTIGSGECLAISGDYYFAARYASSPQDLAALAERIKISSDDIRWLLTLPEIARAGDSIVILRVP